MPFKSLKKHFIHNFMILNNQRKRQSDERPDKEYCPDNGGQTGRGRDFRDTGRPAYGIKA